METLYVMLLTFVGDILTSRKSQYKSGPARGGVGASAIHLGQMDEYGCTPGR